MVDTDYFGIQVGDRIEHYKSTAERRMTYVVIGFVAIQEDIEGAPQEVVKIKYVADYDTSIAYLREVNEMNGYTQNTSGDIVKRFAVLEHKALSAKERDELYELPETNA